MANLWLIPKAATKPVVDRLLRDKKIDFSTTNEKRLDFSILHDICNIVNFDNNGERLKCQEEKRK